MGKPDGKHSSTKKDGGARKAAKDKAELEDKLRGALAKDMASIFRAGFRRIK